MPIVTNNRLKGNYGAALVMSRLSSECLVRLVAADTDVGVDLYCETVAEGQPFLHFWLQVKAGDQCKTDSSTQRASCNFTFDHLRYWKRQPVPVFAALVPASWPVVAEPDVYIIDITTQLLTRDLSTAQQTTTFYSDWHWPARDQSHVQEFLSHIVPNTTARLQVSKGVIVDAPSFNPQYSNIRPEVPALKFKEKIKYQLRVTATNAVIFALREGERTLQDIEFRRLLVRIVEQYGDDPHWENYFCRAISLHADEQYSEALVLYEKSRQLIEADPGVRDEPSWQETVRVITSLEHSAQHELPLSKEELAGEYSGS